MERQNMTATSLAVIKAQTASAPTRPAEIPSPTSTASASITPQPAATAKLETPKPIMVSPTATPKPTMVSPTETPAPTTILATPTSAPQPTLSPTPVARSNANLRSGPGLDYPIVGGVAAGTPLDIVARTDAGDWLLLADGAWISASLVDNVPSVPIADAIPTLPTVSTAQPVAPILATTALSERGSNPSAFTCIGGCAVPPDPSCAIKGNVNSKGEKIYHTPGQRDYERTDIKPEEGDRWFCTPQEAQAAGFRPAQR